MSPPRVCPRKRFASPGRGDDVGCNRSDDYGCPNPDHSHGRSWREFAVSVNAGEAGVTRHPIPDEDR